jgi:hypothetical protein
MYAISHAATALLLKKRWPDVPLWPLLIGAQAIELLWIVLTLFGVEHFSVHQGRISLDFLPYLHSVTSALLLAVVVAAALRTALPAATSPWPRDWRSSRTSSSTSPSTSRTFCCCLRPSDRVSGLGSSIGRS